VLGSRAGRTSSRRALHSSHVSSILCLFKPLAGLPLAYGSAADLVSEIVSFEAAGSSAACVRRYFQFEYELSARGWVSFFLVLILNYSTRKGCAMQEAEEEEGAPGEQTDVGQTAAGTASALHK